MANLFKKIGDHEFKKFKIDIKDTENMNKILSKQLDLENKNLENFYKPMSFEINEILELIKKLAQAEKILKLIKNKTKSRSSKYFCNDFISTK